MSLYSLISSVLSYVFTTIIYLFIFSIIVLIYKDIKKVSRSSDEDFFEDSDDEYFDEEDEETESDEYMEDEETEEYTAILTTVITKESKKFNLRKKYRIGSGPIVVGRSDGCDIVIPDVYLSQEHFEIECKKGIWYLKDLRSKNGTYINDVPVKGTTELYDDDIITFGDIEFIFNKE